MSTTAWIIVIVVVLAVAAAVAWVGDRRRRQQKVEHAEGLRHEAREHAAGIPEAEERARQAEVEAERAQVEAERAQQRAQEAQVAATQHQAVHEDRLRTADEVDPRVDTSSEDYAPGTQVDGTDSAGRAPRT